MENKTELWESNRAIGRLNRALKAWRLKGTRPPLGTRSGWLAWTHAAKATRSCLVSHNPVARPKVY